MPTKIEAFNKTQLKSGLPDIRPGDTVRIHQKIKEGDKERSQAFEGLVIARKHGKGIEATITVRKVVSGVGVEKIFPVHSPIIEKIDLIKRGKTRRAKLYYLRTAKGKRARLKKKDFAKVIANEPPVEEPQAEETPKEEQKTEEVKEEKSEEAKKE